MVFLHCSDGGNCLAGAAYPAGADEFAFLPRAAGLYLSKPPNPVAAHFMQCAPSY